MVPRLLRQGHEVTVLDRCFFGVKPLSQVLQHPQMRLVKDDTRFVDASVFDGQDVVIDLAGLANDPACDLDPQLTDQINYRGAARMANLAKERGVKRYIYSSTCSIYGHGEELQLSEDSPKRPVSEYARAKLRAEEAILPLSSPEFSVTFLRNATLFGLSPKMRFDLVVNVMTLFAFTDGKIYILGGGEQWRPIVHIEDVCRAFEAVLEAPLEKVQGHAFNVGHSRLNYQVITMARMVKRIIPGTELVIVPDDPDKRTYNVNFDKIHDVLGFTTSKDLADGVKEIHDALLANKVKYDVRSRTVEFYRFLIDAERTLNDVMIDGRLF